MANNFKKGAISTGLMVLLAIIAIAAILGIVVIGSYNGLVSSRESVTTAKADIETNLQRRSDLIPNLVNTVKGFTSHEDKIIEQVTSAREKYLGANSLSEKADANQELTNSLSALMVAVEAYPEIKSSQNFIALQDELSGTENRIANSRRTYNEAAQKYNTEIQKFPKSVIAGMFNFEKADYFEASEEAQKVPTVDFSE